MTLTATVFKNLPYSESFANSSYPVLYDNLTNSVVAVADFRSDGQKDWCRLHTRHLYLTAC